MKRIIIKTISFVLVFVLSAIALSSCGNISQYTNGFYDPVHFHEYWWEEDYAGCVDGIERLKLHGSSFVEAIPIDYEGDLFDMKYCIFTHRLKADKEVGFFVDRFDRKVDGVKVMCYAFLEDVKLKDLKRSYLREYKAYRIIVDLDYAKKHDFNYDGLTVDMLKCDFIEVARQDEHRTEERYEYRLKEDNSLVLSIDPSHMYHEKLSNEVIQAIINSVDVEIYKKYIQE